MRRIDTLTNEEFDVELTDELRQDLAEHSEKSCKHENQHLVRHVIRGGSKQVKMQCLTCGATLGQAVSQKSAPENIPDADYSLQQKYKNQRALDYNAIFRKHFQIQKSKISKWDSEYQDYLKSSEWREKRELVIRRAGNICEGCGKAPIEEIHHLTYTRVKREMLFDLVGVCKSCHDKIHADSTDTPEGNHFDEL